MAWKRSGVRVSLGPPFDSFCSLMVNQPDKIINMKNYSPKIIEPKWQKYWDKKKLFKADDKDSKRPKFYCLDMFPYPSGAGLHVGHVESYTATDIYSRFMRMNGYNVLHPQGWDAFGLPAENYAIKTKVHPKITTKKALTNFKRQIKSMGFSYDWDREINTSDPEYYKWTQWIFLELYKNGLAYQKKAPVNWCESCQTVLAREQVIDGKCERCGNIVIQKNLTQWFFKITDYAEKLLDGLKNINWPESIKLMQENWIGRSEGALINFKIQISNVKSNPKSKIQNIKQSIEVFTTRPDTIFGATYLVLAPEHDLITNLKPQISNFKEAESYINKTKKKTELERTSLEKIKTGVELKSICAINPATKKEIPIYIADYVLTTYGTGAIMAVPAHDERDYEFAKKYDLPILEVISSEDNNGKCYTGNGKMINSSKFDGLKSEEAKDEIIKFVGGKKSIQYRLKDWLVSRQRYWGAPIPIIYCDKCGIVPVPEKDLPVKLPDDVDFKPTGESPLARSKKFHDVKCPKCGSHARRESDTMDTFVCSSWYYLRYADPKNNKQLANSQLLKKWLPVDLYIGGKEHATGHLIFSRFITKALKDLKYINFNEPFTRLNNQGIIIASDGRKMSKSLGNVINPDDVVNKYGADSLRMYEMFMGPLEDQKPWDTKGIVGIRRFLDRVWSLRDKVNNESRIVNRELENLIQNTIKKVTEDIDTLKFNTAISAMMILLNVFTKEKEISIIHYSLFIILLSPFAPHLTEELWSGLGHKESIFREEWPKALEVKMDKFKIAVQINGKVRGIIETGPDSTEKEILALARKEINVKKYLENKTIRKSIYISGKILSIVI